MPLGISSWSLHRDLGAGRLSILDFPYKVKALGFEDVEVIVGHLDGNAQVLRERCSDAGIAWNCVSAENNFALLDEQGRKEQVEQVKRAVYLASAVGARIVRAFFGHVTGEPPVGLKYLTLECIKEVARYAKGKGITIAMQNHGNYCNTAEEIVEMIETVRSKNLGACPDTGSFPGDVYSELERLAPLAVHMHAKTYAFNEKGDETRLNYRRIFRILKDAGFEGTYSLEYEGEGEEPGGIEKSLALFRRYT